LADCGRMRHRSATGRGTEALISDSSESKADRGCRTKLFALVSALIVSLGLASQAAAAPPPFDQWLDGLRQEARTAGISEATLNAALTGLEPLERVIELDRKQPEYTQTFWDYLNKRVNPERIERARKMLRTHGALLARVESTYGVQPRFLVAFWGLESNFGDYTGGFSVINALVTLAYDERRADFFRAEVLHALRILDQGHIGATQMQGSWAGAMGQVQFLPSTFARHAVDFDGDGRRDLWNSLPDVFASAANYLRAIGWKGDETWGREVKLPASFDWDLADLAVRKPIGEWQALGVRRGDGGNLPSADLQAAIVLPAGHAGPAFMVYGNFNAILSWNRSILYAIAVGHLADRMIGLQEFSTPRPAHETPLSRDDVLEMQRLLATLGFDTGEPDGVVGSQTRAALKAYQRRSGLPPDGYPTADILRALQLAGPTERQTN
jgi:membrane-bound lytic murein transglycosylase B